MIGDQDRDIACGKAAGVRTVLMDRPYNSRAGADHLATSLLQAVGAILASTPR
jgi:D-glycero-D-manno-heptose 1,7-bisphosphate phosphatase